MPEMFTVASHTWIPACEVRRGPKVKVRVDTVPEVSWAPFDVSTLLPGSCHTRMGVAWRDSSTAAMQVRIVWPPAVVDDVGRIVTMGG